MMLNDSLRVNEQVLAEQKKRAKRERAAEKCRKKTRDKHRSQGLEHTRKYRRDLGGNQSEFGCSRAGRRR